MDLTELVTRCRARDELAWEAVVRRFQARVYGLAFHYLGDAEEARDLAQEIFVQIYEHLPECREPARFVPWMLRIARNAAIDRLRRRRARPPGQDVPADEAVALRSPAPGPDEMWASNRRKRVIHRALQSMSVLGREMIVLKEMHGLKLEEIALVLGVPLGTVKSRSNRARLELARRVAALAAAGAGAGDAGTGATLTRD